VAVISPEGKLIEHIDLGEHATNCIFDGATLYVTATRSAEIEASQRTGTLWAVETDAAGPLTLIPGAL
jgi:sugar lactone lactonase YvrE